MVPISDSKLMRAQAQALAQKKFDLSQELAAMTPEEANAVLHELRVHQIELEMQNEELRSAQLALEESRARYVDLYDFAPVGYCSIGQNGLIVEANLSFANLLGEYRRALIGKLFTRFIVPLDQDSFYLLQQQILSDEASTANADAPSCSVELRLLRRDGKQFWVNLVASQNSRSGHRQLRVVLSDISAYKSAQTALGASERRLRAVIENEPECVKVLSVDGKLLEMNAAGLRMLEAESFQQVQNHCVYALVNQTHRAAFNDLTRRVFQGESGVLEFQITGLKGTRRWLETHVSPLRDDASTITASLGITRDITERKLAEAALRQTASELEQRVIERTQELHAAQISKTRFFAAASHDLLQPLNAARIFASSLAEQSDLSEANQHIVQRIDSALRGAEEVIDVLVGVAKLDTGAVRAVIADVDLAEILAGLADQFSSIAERRNLHLRIGPCQVIVRSDRRLLRRLLQNLVSNALRYTATGGVLVGVRRLPGAQIRIDVVDTGPGIPQANISEIFEEFRRGGQSSPWGEKGLGLGLAICKRICDLLGHTLSVRSRPGHGSIFSLSLANFRVSTDVVSVAPAAVRTPLGLSRLTVLCVDDNIEVLDAMFTLMRSWEVACVQASDRASALEAAQRSRPDVVVVDFQFDDAHSGDGLQIISALRALYPERPPAAIMITANRTVELQMRAKQLGVALLHKPLRAARLRSLLESISRNDDSQRLPTADDFIS